MLTIFIASLSGLVWSRPDKATKETKFTAKRWPAVLQAWPRVWVVTTATAVTGEHHEMVRPLISDN